MAVWKTSEGRIIWLVPDQDAYVEIEPAELAVRVVHTAGRSCLEDEAYEWTYFVEQGELRKRFSTTPYSEPTKVSISTEAQLEPLTGPAADRWERTARDLLDEREGRARHAANEQQREEDERAGSFLKALPDPCAHLVFRAAGRGWSVGLRGESEPFWSVDTFRWRGKDLHHQLRLVLLRNQRAFESFATELTDVGQEMCYHGE